MNYIKQVADILGVELKEDFHIQACGKVFCYNGVPIKFWFDKNGLQTDKIREDDDDWLNLETTIGRLISGTWDLVKKPWKPKLKDIYYFVGSDGEVHYTFNMDSVHDAERISFDNCFRTKRQAEARKEEILNKTKEIFDKE